MRLKITMPPCEPLTADQGLNINIDGVPGGIVEIILPRHGGKILVGDSVAQGWNVGAEDLKHDPLSILAFGSNHTVNGINDSDDALHFSITHADGVTRQQKALNSEQAAILSAAHRIAEDCVPRGHRVVKVRQLSVEKGAKAAR